MKKINSQAYIEMFLLSSGVIGLLGSFFSALVFPKYYVSIICIAVVVANIWYYRIRHNRLSIVSRNTIKVVIVFLSIIFLKDIIWLFMSIIRVVEVNAYLNFVTVFEMIACSSLFEIYLMGLVAAFVVRYSIELFTNDKHTLYYLFIAVIWLAFPYFIKHAAIMSYIYISIFFIISYYFYQISLKYLFPTAMKTFVIIMACITIILCTCHFTIEKNTAFINNVVERFDGLPYLKHSKTGSTVMNSDNSEPLPDVDLPRGNIYLDNGKALEMESTKPYTGFLRGYSMNIYENNKWQSDTISYTFPSLNFYTGAIMGDNMEQPIIMVKPYISHSYQFVPYHSYVSNMLFDSYVPRDPEGDVMNAIVIEKPGIEKYATTMPDYTQAVMKNYMGVDNEMKRILEKYIQDHGYSLSELFGITAQEKITIIKDLLAQNTEYSLTPGALPRNRDFVDYFLNSSKKGSCTHYATTAALFLRVLNVPTRYVSGYVVSASDFQNGVAIINNNRAHAWIEVYDNDYGWYPIDMTPSSGEGNDDSSRLAYMLDGYLEEDKNDTPTSNTTTNNATNSPSTPLDVSKQADASWLDTIWTDYKWHIGIPVGLFLLCFLQYRIRSMKKINAYKRLDNNHKICYLYACLIKNVEANGHLESIALKARFSSQSIDDKELQYFEKECNTLLQENYHKLAWYKKIWNKVITVQ